MRLLRFVLDIRSTDSPHGISSPATIRFPVSETELNLNIDLGFTHRKCTGPIVAIMLLAIVVLMSHQF